MEVYNIQVGTLTYSWVWSLGKKAEQNIKPSTWSWHKAEIRFVGDSLEGMRVEWEDDRMSVRKQTPWEHEQWYKGQKKKIEEDRQMGTMGNEINKDKKWKIHLWTCHLSYVLGMQRGMAQLAGRFLMALEPFQSYLEFWNSTVFQGWARDVHGNRTDRLCSSLPAFEITELAWRT